MPAVTVSLPDDLAEYVAESLRVGTYTSADDLFARALRLLRSQTPAPVGVVELTRSGFDGPAFMAGLVDKLENTRLPKKPR